tara:strand:+ start:2934 stop:3125 length:192 start_codon:yes stop_codon:yes gene_type:complete
VKLQNWLRLADVEEGNRPGRTLADAAEVRELRRRNRLLEQERGPQEGGGVSVTGEPEIGDSPK